MCCLICQDSVLSALPASALLVLTTLCKASIHIPSSNVDKVKLRNIVYIACYLPRITQLVTESARFKPRVSYMRFMLLRETLLEDTGVAIKIEGVPTPSAYSGDPG